MTCLTTRPPGLSVSYLPGRASCKSTPSSVRLELLRKEVASQSLMPASQFHVHLLGALLINRRISRAASPSLQGTQQLQQLQ